MADGQSGTTAGSAAAELLELLQHERTLLENRQLDQLGAVAAAKTPLIDQLRQLDPEMLLADPALAEQLRATRDANAINGRIIARVRAANRSLLDTLTGSSRDDGLYAASGDAAARTASRDLAKA